MTRRPAKRKPTTRRTAAQRVAAARNQAARAEAMARTAAAKLSAMRSRTALATYKAAQIDRFQRDWRPGRKSADAAIIPDLPILHTRARQMVRDDVYARSIVRAMVRNVVGRGIGCVAARMVQGVPDTRWNHAADREWARWSRDPRLVDREGRRNLAAMLRWAQAEEATVGEALLVLSLMPRSGRHRLVLQCVEAEQLDATRTTYQPVDEQGLPARDAAGRPVPAREVHGGVEVDECGAAVAYWIHPRPPADLRVPVPPESVRVPAERVLHYFDPERARQTRGVSRLACAMTRLRHLSEYDGAQLVAARAEACLGLVIETAQPDVALGTPDGTEPAENDELKMLPMMVAKTLPGEKVTTFAPQRPGGLYQQFTMAQLRGIAAGAGLGYEQVARDFTNGSYSSQRQALLEDRREYAMLQDGLCSMVLRPLWETFITEAVLDGTLAAPDFEYAPDGYLAVDFMVDGFDWVDPEKEAKAHQLALELGLDTRKRITGERGMDWRQIDAQRAAEIPAEAARVAALVPPAEPPPPLDAARAAGIIRDAGAVPAESLAAILRAAFPRATADELDAIVEPLRASQQAAAAERSTLLQAIGGPVRG